MQPERDGILNQSGGEISTELNFRPSGGLTVGVELELQLIDPTTRELAPGAMRLLDACKEEKLSGVDGEFLLCMVEVKSDVCRDVTEVKNTFVPLLNRVRSIAHSLGYDVTSGGTHPFARPLAAVVHPDARYQKIQRKQGWSAYQEAIFGLHVHVGVPDANQAIRVSNYLSRYLPHLLALSANSPFWEGIDTHYASSRVRMFHPGAHVGIPPQFKAWRDFAKFVESLRTVGVIEGTKDLYWDIRPRGEYGTLEFRIFDAPPTVDHLLALVALTRCLIAHALEVVQAEPKRGRPSSKQAWLTDENRWQAARYGLESPRFHWGRSQPATLGEDCARLIRRVLPMAQRLSEERYLEPLFALPDFITGAAEQRRTFRKQGYWQAVVDDMRSRWASSTQGAIQDIVRQSECARSRGSLTWTTPRAVSDIRPTAKRPTGAPQNGTAQR